MNLLVGLNGCNSIFGCIYGECARYKNGVPVGKGGRWKKGKARTFNSCRAHHAAYMEETGGNPSKLRNYAGCKNDPIPIYPSHLGDVPILKLFAMCPLHYLLGK